MSLKECSRRRINMQRQFYKNKTKENATPASVTALTRQRQKFIKIYRLFFKIIIVNLF